MYKNPLLALALFCFLGAGYTTFAQTKPTTTDTTLKTPANSKPAPLAGTSWSLVSIQNVRNPNRSAGRVIINFTVDVNGHITQAKADPRRTTIKDSTLIKQCENAVKNANLTGTAPAASPQKAQMRFQFDVD